MRKLRRFVALPAAERRLVVTSALLLGMVRLGLKLLPFRVLISLLDRAARTPKGVGQPAPLAADRIAWAVMLVTPYVLSVRPCLTQALTVQLLLRRRGYAARLHFGVARGEQGRLQAHAWVKTSGRIVIGGTPSELERFTPLLSLDATTA